MSSHDAHPAPAEAQKSDATAEAPKNQTPERNIDVERKRTQELLDNTLGKETARNFKLTGTEAGDVARSAALVAAAESEERSAIDAVLRAPSETERIKAVRDQLRATQNKVRAQAEFNTVATRANTRVMPERDDAPHSALRSAFREYGVPVAGALGVGLTAMGNAFGVGKASSFLLGLLNPQTLLGTYAYGGGYIGAITAGGWVGGKIEQTLRTNFGRSAGSGTLGKTLGAVTAASGMTLMLPGTLPSVAVGASFYGAYKLYQWFKTQRFRNTPAYRNAAYLRTLNTAALTALGKPVKMEANIVGTNLVLTLEKKEKTVDVSGAATNADIDVLIHTGMHDLEHEVHEEHNKHNEVNYRTLLKGWTVPKDITLDFSHAYDHRIRYLYKNAGPTTPPATHYEVNCSAFPESDADAFKNMFDAEVQATIQRVDSADPIAKAKKFTALLKDLKLPEGVELVLIDNAHTANRQVQLRYKGGNTHPPTVTAGTTPQTYIECGAYGDDAIPTMLLNEAEAFKRREDEAGLTPAIKFTKLLKGIKSIPGMELDYTNTKDRKLVATYRKQKKVEIDCTDIHDEYVADYVSERLEAIRHRIDEARQTSFETQFARLTGTELDGIEHEMIGTNQRTVKFKLGGVERTVNCMSVADTAVYPRLQLEISTLRTMVRQKREREIAQWATEYPSSTRFTVTIDPANSMNVILTRTPAVGIPSATPATPIQVDATNIMSKEALHNELTRQLRSQIWIS